MHIVDSKKKNKYLIYKGNLGNADFANTARTTIWCPVFDFQFKNIERFIGLYILMDHIPQFCS